MKTTSQKKLGKIGILIKENAPDWFQQMESHLRGELQWKIIQDVVTKQEREGAKRTARILKKTPMQEIFKSIPKPGNTEALIRLFNNKI